MFKIFTEVPVNTKCYWGKNYHKICDFLVKWNET